MTNSFDAETALSLIEDIETCTSIQGLVALLDARLSELGVVSFVVSQVAGLTDGDRPLLGTFNMEWQERFLRNKYDHKDPVIKALISGQSSVSISQTRKTQSRNTKGWHIMNEATEFDIVDGWSFGLPAPQGHFSVATFTGIELTDEPDLKSALKLIAIIAHSKMLSLLDQPRRQISDLSDRERDVMAWIASGKSDDEIGHILNVSTQTVHKFVERAKFKLGVSRRSHAVVEAIRHRQILI